jgi:hypothetical protein
MTRNVYQHHNGISICNFSVAKQKINFSTAAEASKRQQKIQFIYEVTNVHTTMYKMWEEYQPR